MFGFVLEPGSVLNANEPHKHASQHDLQDSGGFGFGFATFGSFDQLDLHHFFAHRLPPADIEPDERAGLLQGLYSSAVGHIANVYLIDPQDNVVDPETENTTGCQSSPEHNHNEG